MTAFKKSRLLFMIFLTFLSGSLFAGLGAGQCDNIQTIDISLNYMGKERFNGTITVECSNHDNVCHYLFEPHQNEIYQNPGSIRPVKNLKFEGHFHYDLSDATELGSITVSKDNRETKIPLSINFEELQLGEKDNPLTRAIITQLHPSLAIQAYRELSDTAEISDYLIGETKNSKSLHLFKPEQHHLTDEDTAKLKKALGNDFIVLDIGDSYSMIILFDEVNLPSSIHVLDRWRLYRDPAFKTVIGYGDLWGLVLHGNDLADHAKSFLSFNPEEYLHGGMHLLEIIDHAHGVGEFISGSHKHYHDHHHGLLEHIFGVLHVGHTFWELVQQPTLPHHIQMALTVASFGYHHLPQRLYEYSITEVIDPVIKSGKREILKTEQYN